MYTQKEIPFSFYNVAEVKLSYSTNVKPEDRPKITQAYEAYEVIKPFFFNEGTVEHIETAYMLMMNRDNRVLGVKQLSVGGVSGTVMDAKIIFQSALLANSSAIMLFHNHPSGNKKPSKADINLTKQLNKGAKLLGIQLVDHIIVTPQHGVFVSLMAEGYI